MIDFAQSVVLTVFKKDVIMKKFLSKHIKDFALVFVFIYGMLASVFSASKLWFVDADIAAISIFLKEYHNYGWKFVKTFHFPIDNWFFSIIIPDGLLFRVFGNHSYILMLTGVFFFLVTALFSGLLVYYLTGIRRGLWAGALVLSAPAMALGQGGFLTYPVAHNVSIAWGMPALLLCVVWGKRGSFFALLGSFVLFSLSAFSDPWLFPAFILPLICAACVLVCLRPGEHAGRYLTLICVAVGVTLLCKTHFFGALAIEQTNVKSLAKLRLSLSSLPAMGGALSYYFNFIPFCNFNRFYAALSNMDKKSIDFFISCMVFNFAAIVYVLTRLVRKVWQERNSMDQGVFFVCLVLFFSVLGIISSSFIFGGMRHIDTSRYMANIYYCVIIFVCLLPYAQLTPKLRRGLFLLAVLWVVSSIISNYEMWREKDLFVDGEKTDVASVLEQEHIQYVFGDYWGLNAHAVTWLSNERVEARPMLYIQEYRGFLPTIWSSPFWYKLPPHTRWAFVVTGVGDDAVCPPYPSCREAVIHQFGQPLAIREEKRLSFFIYDSDKTQLPADMNVENWHDPLPILPESLPHWQNFYPNGEMNGSDLVTLDGWDDVKHGQVESLARVAHIGVPAVTIEGRIAKMWLRLASASSQCRNIDILYKGTKMAQWRVCSKETIRYLELPVDKDQTSLEYDISILNPEHAPHNALRGIRLYGVQLLTKDGHL